MKILTANRLSDGIAVWMAADHSWAETIEGGQLANEDDAIECLERAGQAAFLKNEVVDLALIDVDVVEDEIIPRRLREKIRAQGPTIRLDLGKQAQDNVQVAA